MKGFANYLRRWDASLCPTRIDLVCDFAGKELFAIHGESLLAHCVKNARVDFEDGFQMLHAVYAVESFLSKIKQRDCNFHILWFDSYEDLAVPPHVRGHEHKYFLLRVALIEHLRFLTTKVETIPDGSLENDITKGPISYLFSSMESDEFKHYLKGNHHRFVLCSRGGGKEPESSGETRRINRIAAMYSFAEKGNNLALIDNIEFRSSSKIYAQVIPARPVVAIKLRQPASRPMRELGCGQFLQLLGWPQLLPEAAQPEGEVDAREMIALIFCASILTTKPGPCTQKRVAAFLVHIAMLRRADLTQRSFGTLAKKVSVGDHEFLEGFSDVARTLIQSWLASHEQKQIRLKVCDLVDGRLFQHVLQNLESMNLVVNISSNVRVIKSLVGVDISCYLPAEGAYAETPTRDELDNHLTSKLAPSDGHPNGGVFFFNHPMLDAYLDEIELRVEKPAHGSNANSEILQKPNHLHNANKLLNPKRAPRPKDLHARRRDQKFMADTIAYSASLTNASGKNIDPEIIVVSKYAPERKGTKQGKQKHERTTTKVVKVATSNAKSGTQKAREAAEEIRATKDRAKSADITRGLAQRCRSFDQVGPLVNRYVHANMWLHGLSDAYRQTIGGELHLYLCDILTALIATASEGTRMSTAALLRSHAIEAGKLPLTVEARNQLQHLKVAFRLSTNPVSCCTEVDRPLPFKSELKRIAKHFKLPQRMTARQFQLEHCGPYMERSFDSAADPRVPFRPDAWQRQVLDAIDNHKSLFVVAPTSSGKTFISFYAMKKILQANNDDVLVYVAPTKALVNQVAAEIQARFSKSYNRAGRSVWAIHTRDYRINNPSGCQILVTVPHILQIMLLSPCHAETPESWSRRVKYVIFDEVHCIGQADDGIIWEQLLLLAPCPIIALSATVGNPLHFKEWLHGVQKAKGFDLEMVVHSTRYSDLRNFIYQPPSSDGEVFEGFQNVERLPIPGLDAADSESKRFVSMHPAAGNIDSKQALQGISFEPRDCFKLWQTMNQYENESNHVGRELDPDVALPELIKKSDVSKWEIDLKEKMYSWILDPSSPLNFVRSSLGTVSTPSSSLRKTIDSTFHLLVDLRSRGALPAIVFHYERGRCEEILQSVVRTLEDAEQRYRHTSPEWRKKVDRHNAYRNAESTMKKTSSAKQRGNRRGDQDDGTGVTKMDLLREDTNQEISPEASFNPDFPIEQYSFADFTKISKAEFESMTASLRYAGIKTFIIDALRRGLGVHHAGMNRRYRQVVEILFRKGFLTAVIATGTLALGLNMPCKTVVFAGDSIFLNALNYRQASGRAGRRGFDLLGNVVFHGVPHQRVLEIMTSRLPDLKGQFPMSVTLVLRLLGLYHGTNGSDYAVKAIESLLSQTRLYLGGPSSKMSIKHHLRFSIDYLRRQHLLSANGAPLNFSGLVGHLYFTENAVFAFHSLLKEGYLHELCKDVRDMNKRKDTLLNLLTVLCHLFCRIPCSRYMSMTWLRDVVQRSPSIVLLPRLSPEAERILMGHNQATLNIFQVYVRTFVEQHLTNTPDDVLPFTNRRIVPKDEDRVDISASKIPLLPPTVVRSTFAALSGFTDDFDTIHELCETVRAGVFLEESSVPYIPIYPDETDGVPFNAYILDFFKHGDLRALVRDNGLSGGDVWFHLKDFSLILRTIVASLAISLGKDGANFDDTAMMDIQDVGNALEESFEDKLIESDIREGVSASDVPATTSQSSSIPFRGKKEKHKVPSSWDEASDQDDNSENEVDAGSSADDDSGAHAGSLTNSTGSLGPVYEAFVLLQQEFDEKFKKTWA